MFEIRRLSWAGRFYFWLANHLYHEFAWTYDLVSWLVSFGRWSGWRRNALDHVCGRRILEIGYGTGELLLESAVRGLSIIGIDPSCSMQRIAKRKLQKRGLSSRLVRGKSQAVPFADNSFDTILSTFPAEFMFDIHTLKEVTRLLVSPNQANGFEGGRMVIVGLAVYDRSSAESTLLDRLLGVDRRRVQVAFMQLVREAGLKVEIVYPKDERNALPVVILTHVKE